MKGKGCWLLEFNFGHSVLYSEELYAYVKEKRKDFDGHILTKEIYFADKEKCFMQYPKLKKYGF